MIRALSNELAPANIQVNGVAPGFVDTTFTSAISQDRAFFEQTVKRIPSGRWAVPDDMIAAAIYLASAASNYSESHLIGTSSSISVEEHGQSDKPGPE